MLMLANDPIHDQHATTSSNPPATTAHQALHLENARTQRPAAAHSGGQACRRPSAAGLDCAPTDARAPASLQTARPAGCCRCDSRSTPGTEGLHARVQACVPAAPDCRMRRTARGWSTRAYCTQHAAHSTNVRSTRVRGLRALPTRARSTHAQSTLRRKRKSARLPLTISGRVTQTEGQGLRPDLRGRFGPLQPLWAAAAASGCCDRIGPLLRRQRRSARLPLTISRRCARTEAKACASTSAMATLGCGSRIGLPLRGRQTSARLPPP